MGKTYYQLQDIKKACEVFQQCLEEEKAINNVENIYNIHSYLTGCYYGLQDYNLALDHAFECEKIGASQNNPQMSAKIEGELVPFIIELFLRLGRFAEVPAYLEREKKFVSNFPEKDPRWVNYYEKVGSYN